MVVVVLGVRMRWGAAEAVVATTAGFIMWEGASEEALFD